MHIASEKGDSNALFTDVLLILSHADYSRAVNVTPEPWFGRAMRVLLQEFDDFCRNEAFQRRFPHRQLGLRILCDGSADMSGQALGLEAGEFVTGLLPNLYTGPVRGSHPVIGVHLNLPDAWEGYKEVGRLYSDQILFTVGNHWLDNYSHPSLKEGALYRLQQAPDGSFVHVINPDLQDRYQVTSTDQGGASVLTLATREGAPIAYMVLAVIDPPVDQKPGIQMPQQTGRTATATIPPPMLIEDAVQPGLHNSRTIIPDAPSERIFTLQERGALLQRVHFEKFMEGYDVFLGSRGELGTVVDDIAATFKVRRRTVALVAQKDGVSVGGRSAPVGVEIPLESNTTIQVGAQKLDYRDLRTITADGWPYVAEIRRPASSNYMVWGGEYRVGRSRECRVGLPDESRNDNIQWKAAVGDGATIRARSGEIPKSQFYTDSIMVASEHAAFDLRSAEPRIVCTARHCYTYVRRGQDFFALYPTESGAGVGEMELLPGDEVLVGNCLFQVGFSPAGEEAVAPAPAPKVELSADALVGAVNAPNFALLDAPSNPERPGVSSDEPAAARGLGQRGRAPEPLPVSEPIQDSILGLKPEFDDEQTEPPTNPKREPREVLAQLYDEDDESATFSGLRPGAPPISPVANDEWDADGPLPGFQDEERTVADIRPQLPKASLIKEEPAPEPSSAWLEPPGPPTPQPASPRAVAPPPPPAAPPPPPAAPPPPAPPAARIEPEPTVVAPRPAAAPPAPPAAAPERAADSPKSSEGEVVAVDDAQAQFELGRPLQVIHIGWAVNGQFVCGNHTGADLVIPENRVADQQNFKAVDYFVLKVRGRRGSLDVVTAGELLINGDDPSQATYEELEGLTIDVIRRDDRGEEDFAVRLEVKEDKALPDPRARWVAIDAGDPLAAALFTRGLPVRSPRTLALGDLTLTLLYDGEGIEVSEYLASYRDGAGFKPFFVQRGQERFQTAPEDGSSFRLSPGDRLVIGNAVFVLRKG